MKLRILVLICLATAAIALQQTPIPQYEGDDNPSHDGQPKFCQNMDTAAHAHNCECHAMKPTPEQCERDGKQEHDEGEDQREGGESPKCKVYCRKTACRCRNNCGG